MRKYAWVIFSIGLTASLVGCGSDSGSGGSGGSAGTGGSAGSGGSAGGGGESGGTMVAVNGNVSAAALEGDPTPLEGATVSVVGTSNTATTDGAGNFTIMAPTGTVMFRATANAHWGSMFPEDIPDTGFSGLEIEVVPDALVNTVAGVLETTADTSKGIVAVAFDETTVSGGESASISVGSELSFIFNAMDAPEEGDTLVENGGSDVIFINSDVSDSVTVTARNLASQDCPLYYPSASFSVEAKVFTEIEVYCP